MYQSNKTKWVQHNGDSDIDNLGKALSTHIGCAVRLAPYSNHSKPIFECRHGIPFPIFAVSSAVINQEWGDIIERHNSFLVGGKWSKLSV